MNIRFFSITFVLVILFSCSGKKNKYDPDNFLSAKEKDYVKAFVVRHASKLPRRTLDSSRHDPKFDEHFEKQMKEHFLKAYFVSKDGDHYFLITRKAPSMVEKWVATGGRMSVLNNGEIREYEEIFRTWKMEKQDLDERAPYLFDLMVRGQDLTPYYTATAGFNYIEFPDDQVYFDKESGQWKSLGYKSVEEIVYESRDSDTLAKKPN